MGRKFVQVPPQSYRYVGREELVRLMDVVTLNASACESESPDSNEAAHLDFQIFGLRLA